MPPRVWAEAWLQPARTLARRGPHGRWIAFRHGCAPLVDPADCVAALSWPDVRLVVPAAEVGEILGWLAQARLRRPGPQATVVLPDASAFPGPAYKGLDRAVAQFLHRAAYGAEAAR